jgi:hypothetical protein
LKLFKKVLKIFKYLLWDKYEDSSDKYGENQKSMKFPNLSMLKSLIKLQSTVQCPVHT